MDQSLIVLAAGEGSRMASDTPKVLHQIAGQPLLHHAMAAGAALAPSACVVVVGHGGAAVAAAARDADPQARIATQSERRGTGHAVAQALPLLAGFEGAVLVLYGDTPLIAPRTLAAMRAALQEGAGLVVLGFEAADPGRYGRLVAEAGALVRIVEWKDASEAERAITLCNSGVVLARKADLERWIAALGCDNAAGEYYLTDIAASAVAEGATARVVTCPEAETLGVNTRAELAAAEAAFQTRARARALADGVTLTAPETVVFCHDTALGRDAVVEPHVIFGPGVTVESGARIRAFSHLEGAHVSAGATVGPYARLRPGAEIGPDARIGNFVEIKAASLGPGAKVNHLSYVGDASVGARANLGAGTITCNYDGVMKHQTRIGAEAFIGSDTILVAPVAVGAGAMTAAGSTITEDVPEGALAIARARQSVKPGLGRRLMAHLRQVKSRLTAGQG